MCEVLSNTKTSTAFFLSFFSALIQDLYIYAEFHQILPAATVTLILLPIAATITVVSKEGSITLFNTKKKELNCLASLIIQSLWLCQVYFCPVGGYTFTMEECSSPLKVYTANIHLHEPRYVPLCVPSRLIHLLTHSWSVAKLLEIPPTRR